MIPYVLDGDEHLDGEPNNLLMESQGVIVIRPGKSTMTRRDRDAIFAQVDRNTLMDGHLRVAPFCFLTDMYPLGFGYRRAQPELKAEAVREAEQFEVPVIEEGIPIDLTI